MCGERAAEAADVVLLEPVAVRAETGLTVYLVSALSEFTSVADVQAAVIGTSGNSGAFAGARTGSNAQGTVRGLDDGLSGQTQGFYYVIVSSDGKGFWASGKQSAEIYTTATTHQDNNVAASTFKLSSLIRVSDDCASPCGRRQFRRLFRPSTFQVFPEIVPRRGCYETP